MTDQAPQTLPEALLAFQAECPTLKKDSTNPHFKSKFVSLDAIVEAVKPLLAKHGLTWMTFPGRSDGECVLRYTLTHAVSGESVTGTMPLLLQKQDPQGLGSALTYARRYALSAVLNLVADDDDDGNSGSQQPRQQPRPPAKQSKLPVDLLDKLRQGYQATGWDVPMLRRHLAQFGVQGVEDLTVAQAEELLTVMNAAADVVAPDPE